jgi:hypothetical protein
MNNRSSTIRAIFRGIARVHKTFTIEIGSFRATGVPAILVGVSGIVVASGVAAVLVNGANRMPETLNAARGLAEALSGGAPAKPALGGAEGSLRSTSRENA